MKTALLAAAVAAAVLFAAGCETEYGEGYGGGYYAAEPGDWDVYYDGFYGPYAGGYWGDDDFFYYEDEDGGYRRDVDHHFRRAPFTHARGFHSSPRARMSPPPSDNGGG
ncbi:MAG: hypothetical protein KGJ78_13865 [Alphaproteobacteria bacterium]|nr:hypothetical protein [Alphaproteobacteria bacterium]